MASLINKPQIPRIGVGVIIIKQNQVLMGKRINSHGSNTWNFPGGHLEFKETPMQCAQREVLEETGLQIKDIKPGPWTNDFFPKENKHYITLFMISQWVRGEPQILEPHKCSQWAWFLWNQLPTPLFIPTQNLLNQNFNPFSMSLK